MQGEGGEGGRGGRRRRKREGKGRAKEGDRNGKDKYMYTMIGIVWSLLEYCPVHITVSGPFHCSC